MSKRLTDPKFKYVPAAKTDLRKTFARIRRQMREHGDANDATPASPDADAQDAYATRRVVNRP